ncbi:MAG: hypothetical protein F6K04_20005, partial [Leptolyngbya sp. SIO4C5]|nr:hypothetical protein [Leptolyngbya sp. SIO4C5]
MRFLISLSLGIVLVLAFCQVGLPNPEHVKQLNLQDDTILHLDIKYCEDLAKARPEYVHFVSLYYTQDADIKIPTKTDTNTNNQSSVKLFCFEEKDQEAEIISNQTIKDNTARIAEKLQNLAKLKNYPVSSIRYNKINSKEDEGKEDLYNFYISSSNAKQWFISKSNLLCNTTVHVIQSSSL